MVNESHVGQTITYRGRALDFPRGITSITMILGAVGPAGDAWLESPDGTRIFGVKAEDCIPIYIAPLIVDPEFDSWKMEPVIPNPRRK